MRSNCCRTSLATACLVGCPGPGGSRSYRAKPPFRTVGRRLRSRPFRTTHSSRSSPSASIPTHNAASSCKRCVAWGEVRLPASKPCSMLCASAAPCCRASDLHDSFRRVRWRTSSGMRIPTRGSPVWRTARSPPGPRSRAGRSLRPVTIWSQPSGVTRTTWNPTCASCVNSDWCASPGTTRANPCSSFAVRRRSPNPVGPRPIGAR